MNKITTLAAISMFAVIMGMSAIAPAMAGKGNPNGAADTPVCHLFAAYTEDEVPVYLPDESSWDVLFVNEKGLNGHTSDELDAVHNDDVFEFVGEFDPESEDYLNWLSGCQETEVPEEDPEIQ